jgi:hypothetical protein
MQLISFAHHNRTLFVRFVIVMAWRGSVLRRCCTGLALRPVLVLKLWRDTKVGHLVTAQIDEKTRECHELGRDSVPHHPVTIDRIAFLEIMNARKQKVGRNAAPDGQERSFLELFIADGRETDGNVHLFVVGKRGENHR